MRAVAPHYEQIPHLGQCPRRVGSVAKPDTQPAGAGGS